MPGLREAGLAAAALALTGGVAYAIWNLRSNKKNEAETPTLEQNVNAEKREKLVEAKVRSESAHEAPAPVSQEQARGSQVLVLGLDGAGKTSLLQCFATGTAETEVSPTMGFNAVSINREELRIDFLEIGGEEKLREFWPKYMKKARLLVFVLDAADSARFPLAKTSLHQLLAFDPCLPLVLLANKQDLPGASGVTELYESMALGSDCDGRKLCVLGTQVLKGSADISVQDAYALILEMMNSN
ncbi:ADP-ribosylation factor-like protein 9 isoform 2-T2 [Clarias gariepinus]|uniref:ADP-ribosylation factor-like protein 9 isoform X2 n=1 Tax=Clarias gariepinus TaxID=13013 RepID=UPI00234DC425|nr:ADP-ribosylation factor-like protein 9 isoform X2 [Clarias gariepinus]